MFVNCLTSLLLNCVIHTNASIHCNVNTRTWNPSNSKQLSMIKSRARLFSKCFSAKSTHEQSLIHNFTTKMNFKILCFIKEFTKSHIMPPQMHNDSTIAATNFNKTELLNQYFYFTFTQRNPNIPWSMPVLDYWFILQNKMYWRN